ncbi:MAG: NfeD family protein [Euryarchaeota archaeon]|nr:NfeD family protein [Euryarchaeota archaeon]
MIIGIIMLIAEIFSPGVFMVVPATVLIVLGAIGMIAPDILLSWWSPIIAVILIVPLMLITVKMYQKLSPPMPPTTTVATSLIGQEGVVVTMVCPGNLKGKVKIDSDVWSATSDEAIPVGARVKVIHSEGVHVRVKNIGEAFIPVECRQELR